MVLQQRQKLPGCTCCIVDVALGVDGAAQQRVQQVVLHIHLDSNMCVSHCQHTPLGNTPCSTFITDVQQACLRM